MKIEDAIRQKYFENNKQKAFINLNYTFNRLQDLHAEVFKKFDITSQQYNVLRILRGRYPGYAYCAEVKEVMLDKNPDLTRLCDRLLIKGLIERSLNEVNRRQVVLQITEQGLKLLEEIVPVLENKKFFGSLTEAEADTLSNLLDKLRG